MKRVRLIITDADQIEDEPRPTGGNREDLPHAEVSSPKGMKTTNGMLRIEDLYEAPFTQLHAEGVEGVFPHEEQVSRLLDIIANSDPSNVVSESTA